MSKEKANQNDGFSTQEAHELSAMVDSKGTFSNQFELLFSRLNLNFS